MTLLEFRAVARAEIQRGAPLYGEYWIDHRDDTLYLCTRWLNVVDIACDQFWSADHPDYYRERRQAQLREDTRHWPRSIPPTA
jgi:hypothetical protein